MQRLHLLRVNRNTAPLLPPPPPQYNSGNVVVRGVAPMARRYFISQVRACAQALRCTVLALCYRLGCRPSMAS